MKNRNPRPRKSRIDKAFTYILWVFAICLAGIFVLIGLHLLKIREFDFRFLMIVLGTFFATINRIVYLVFKSIFTKSLKK